MDHIDKCSIFINLLIKGYCSHYRSSHNIHCMGTFFLHSSYTCMDLDSGTSVDFAGPLTLFYTFIRGSRD